MTPAAPLDLRRIEHLYELAERRYAKSLPLEHFAESVSSARQRAITLESFDLVHVSRKDVQCFNELLVQYPVPGKDPDRPGQIVPDNMVVIHPKPIVAEGSYMTPLQPVGPFLVLEYVSKNSTRKDYEVSYAKYEQELKVPYYLAFYPDADELTLFRLKEGKYLAVPPDGAGRRAIPELELEVALLDGWVRYWFRGELLPLPGDLLQQLNATREELTATRTELTRAKGELDAARLARLALEVEVARLREEAAKAKGQS
jgi:Uma2 family endonuclease